MKLGSRARESVFFTPGSPKRLRAGQGKSHPYSFLQSQSVLRHIYYSKSPNPPPANKQITSAPSLPPNPSFPCTHAARIPVHLFQKVVISPCKRCSWLIRCLAILNTIDDSFDPSSIDDSFDSIIIQPSCIAPASVTIAVTYASYLFPDSQIWSLGPRWVVY